MQCEKELNYIGAMLNDFLVTLPPSVRETVGQNAGAALKNLTDALKQAAAPAAAPAAEVTED